VISHEHKFIFIHIPKTGGTSVENALQPFAKNGFPFGKHHSLKRAYEDDSISEDYFSFSFVRNPWSLCVSLYHWTWECNSAWPKTWRSKKETQEFVNLTFSEWIKHPYFHSESPRVFPLPFKLPSGKEVGYRDWLIADNKEVNFVGKFETLQEDFNIICDRIGIPRQQLPHKNKTDHVHYSEYYKDDEIRDIVSEKYSGYIERFGYEFGE